MSSGRARDGDAPAGGLAIYGGYNPTDGWVRSGETVLDGADPNLFEGAIWVLTPDGDADDVVFARLTAVVAESPRASEFDACAHAGRSVEAFRAG